MPQSATDGVSGIWGCVVLTVSGWARARGALIIIFLLSFAGPTHAKKYVAPVPEVYLYTFGPGESSFARYGHSMLCVPRADKTQGRCYDYGVFWKATISEIVWGTVRGRPMFRLLARYQNLTLDVYRKGGRSIEIQKLPLSAEAARAFVAELEVLQNQGNPASRYVYHPYTANCSTKIRDRLNELFGGKLRGANDLKDGPTFRSFTEGGFRGNLAALAGLDLLTGGPVDDRTSQWDRGYLPLGLRDLVTARLSIEPVLLHAGTVAPLDSPIKKGGPLYIVLGMAFALLFAVSARRKGVVLGWPVRALGYLSGLLGLIAAFGALSASFSELSSNWIPIVLFPTDFVLGHLSIPRRSQYLKLRLGAIALLLVLGALGIVTQPLLSVASLVIPAFVTLLVAERRSAAKLS